MQRVLNAGFTHVRCLNLRIRADRSLLSNFSWQHRPGGIAWILGSNGSGKSSLLRVLAGWQKPDAGHVAWGNVASAIHYFNPAMSAASDLRVGDFSSMVERMTARPDADAASLLPDTVSPAKRFGQLSTGEAKRILLWAVLLGGGGPLLLDEPYEHLSRDAKARLTQLLQDRAARDVVIVATNQDVPERGSDTLLTFEGDQITVGHGG